MSHGEAAAPIPEEALKWCSSAAAPRSGRLGLISRILMEKQSVALSNTNDCSAARRRQSAPPRRPVGFAGRRWPCSVAQYPPLSSQADPAWV